MKYIALFTLALMFSSCQKEAKETTQEGPFKVELLFEHNGCKVYRFYDGRTIYWSDCSGRIEYQYQTRHQVGKSMTTNTHHVETLND